ncbi:MAG: M17 family peptidase N-terminal domain-containing protein, partial [Pseudomonadota bacterium]
MTTPLIEVHFESEAEASWSEVEGTLVVFLTDAGDLSAAAKAVDDLSMGALSRAMGSPDFEAKAGILGRFDFPAGLAASRVILASVGDQPKRAAMRKVGASLATVIGRGDVTIAASGIAADALIAELVFGTSIKLYNFTEYKSASDDESKGDREIRVVTSTPETLAAASADFAALAEGIFFTRDLVNEPANRLTTDEFAARLAAMQEIGLEVEILGEPELEEMGARALLAVGQGSDNESKIVVMKWMGGGDEAPVAVVGKGVIFDTGGISLKPAAGMEDMTMDMGGAGVVSGLMRTLALRRAKANVIGIVGLVENMPDARAQRPGDIVKSMKGETIEVINTDAEGRLVLADALWYAQKTFNPSHVIDLATLTGAVIVALSKTKAGYF